MAESMKHENRLRMNQVRHHGLDLAAADLGSHFHHIPVFNTEFLGFLIIDPEGIFGAQFVQIGVILGGHVGMQCIAPDHEPELTVGWRRHGFVGRKGFKAGILQQRGFKFNFTRWGLKLEPVLAVPENLTFTVGHKALFFKVFHGKTGTLQLPGHQLIHVFIGKIFSDTQPLADLLENHGTVAGIVAGLDNLLS